MIRLLREHRFAKYVCVVAAMTLACTAVLFAVFVNRAHGEENKYNIIGSVSDTTNQTSVTVSPEGGNQKGKMGSGIAPLSADIPTAEGKKGSETNPFVILEIVPELQQQQLIYLNTSRDDYPLGDLMQIGIDDSHSKNLSFVGRTGAFGDDFPTIKSLGDWFFEYTYEVNKFGSEEEKTETKLAKPGKIYTLSITDDKIQAAGYNKNDFKNDYDETWKNAHDFVTKYPNLFKTDDRGKEIRDIALSDNMNWSRDNVISHDVYTGIKVTPDEINGFNNKTLTIKEISERYPNLFKTDDDGEEISQAELNDNNAWWVDSADKWKEYEIETTKILNEDTDASIAELAEKYPNIFSVDKNGNEIPKKILQMDGWEKQIQKEKIQYNKEEDTQNLTHGYMVNVGIGKGSISVKPDSNSWSHEMYYGNQWYGYANFTNDPDAKNNWIYVENESDLLNYKSFTELDDFESIINERRFDTSDEYTGYYLDVSNAVFANGCTLTDVTVTTTVIPPQCSFTFKQNVPYYTFHYKTTHDGYKFYYHGVVTTDVLKRSLFLFKDKEECDNFHLKVVAMTPAMLNEACKGDTPDTLDWVERADMFYIAAYNSSTDNIGSVTKLYHDFVARDYANTGTLKDFSNNDLEWELVYKILERGANNASLPIMFNKAVGEPLEQKATDQPIYMYITDKIPCFSASMGAYNNIAKLYLICIQLDLLARNNDDRTRCFSEDILPKFKTAQLSESIKNGKEQGSATTTGYYPRREPVKQDLTSEEKEAACYLWNTWTFYPEELEAKWDGMDQITPVEDFVNKGYLATFFDTNADPFRDGGSSVHQNGGSGYENNVGIVNNGQVANVNQSTLLGGRGATASPNNFLTVSYTILNKIKDNYELVPIEFKLNKYKKSYERLSNEEALIDYELNYNYSGDKQLYLKATLTNKCNEPGILQSVQIIRDIDSVDEKKREVVPLSEADITKTLSKEQVEDSTKTYKIKGYRIEAGGSITVYIPFSMEEWQKGWNTVRFNTRSQNSILQGDKPVTTLGGVFDYDVSIFERTLFQLS